MNPFSSSRSATDTGFDEEDESVPEHVPVPGPFLEGHDVLEREGNNESNDRSPF
ncbi:hypothetical protein HYG81_14385 [Natrinema zhouii]|uniref:DUF7998 domain-containing protein n=1 Tax=Natrinema zhouii TaxID=1710539 RepID=A0A7D6CPT0_9EURY|nr:hypothetical protein [Natrinema zhouii]QLK25270.1 hypothetical protein HYG81_14385 [Natrinema zhouii]